MQQRSYLSLGLAISVAACASGCAARKDPARAFAAPTPAVASGFCGSAASQQNAPIAVGVRCTLRVSSVVFLSMGEAQSGQEAAGANPYGIVTPGDCVIHDVTQTAFSCVAVSEQHLEITGVVPELTDDGGFVNSGGTLYVSTAQ